MGTGESLSDPEKVRRLQTATCESEGISTVPVLHAERRGVARRCDGRCLAGSPPQSRRCRSGRRDGTLSRIYNAAEDKGRITEGSNPCRLVLRNREQKRERFLTPDELKRLGRALDEADRRRGVREAAFRVASVERRTVRRQPPAAFTTRDAAAGGVAEARARGKSARWRSPRRSTRASISATRPGAHHLHAHRRDRHVEGGGARGAHARGPRVRRRVRYDIGFDQARVDQAQDGAHRVVAPGMKNFTR